MDESKFVLYFEISSSGLAYWWIYRRTYLNEHDWITLMHIHMHDIMRCDVSVIALLFLFIFNIIIWRMNVFHLCLLRVSFSFSFSSMDRWWSIITRVGDIMKWKTSRVRNENCFFLLLVDWLWNRNLPFCTSFRHLLHLRGGHLHRFALLESREAILVYIAMQCDSMLPPFLFHNSILANEK